MASPLELVCALALAWLPSEARVEEERSTWISRSEILALPTSGKSWAAVLSAARRPMEAADLGVRDSFTDVHVLARALVYARTGEERYRMEALQGVKSTAPKCNSQVCQIPVALHCRSCLVALSRSRR
jgi:hypothetical protein